MSVDYWYNYPLLIKWRTEAGLKHEQACAAAGISFSYLYHLEKHGGNPSGAILVRLASVYGHDISELFDPDLADAS